MRNTISSRKQAKRCAVGIVIINANISSINVLNALYINDRHGSAATDFNL